jgi:hypothetical protein
MKELELSGSKFRVHENGELERQLKSGSWKLVKNTANHNQGYNVVLIQKRQYMRSRLMFLAFLNIQDDQKYIAHYKDGNRLNCALTNLSIETYSSIASYRT